MLLTALVVYLFFPHHSNNHKAKLLSPLIVVTSIVMFILGQLLVPLAPKFAPVVLGYVSNISPEKVIELTNKERIAAGYPTVELDPLLTQAAIAKAYDMFSKDYWAHIGPDGTQPWKFVLDTGYKYRFAGENLARDFASPEAVVRAWMDSPTHKENLLSSRYRDIGVAVVKGELSGVQTTLIVQFFGSKMEKINFVDSSQTSLTATIPATLSTPQVAGTTLNNKIFLSPYLAKKNIAFFVISLFFTLFTIDMVVIKHKNLPRISSKSFAHLVFFGMILGVIIISRAGNIL